MKRIIKIAGGSILLLLLTAGGFIFAFRQEIKSYFIPTVEQLGDIHIKVKDDTSHVSVRLVVKNKSFLEIKIDTIKYKISLFHKTYIQNKKALGIHLPGYGNDTINFSLKIPYLTIIKDIKEERKKRDSATYHISVFLQYTTAFGTKEFPIQKTARLKIPQPPEIEIVDIKWKRIRLKSMQAIATIKITSHTRIALAITNMNYTMDILSQGSLTGDYKEPITIHPKGTTFVDLPLDINVKNMGKTLFQIVTNKDNYKYALVLHATLTSTNPVKESFKIDIVKNGRIELKK